MVGDCHAPGSSAARPDLESIHLFGRLRPFTRQTRGESTTNWKRERSKFFASAAPQICNRYAWKSTIETLQRVGKKWFILEGWRSCLRHTFQEKEEEVLGSPVKTGYRGIKTAPRPVLDIFLGCWWDSLHSFNLHLVCQNTLGTDR